jgi:hypothetical protein
MGGMDLAGAAALTIRIKPEMIRGEKA